jgi:hypothetical protein
LTVNQRKLVADIGFENLLYISCDYIPRGVISFLVSNFDSQSRSLHLPNGSTICIDAACINTILGTPIGGKVIGEIVDQDLRRTISELTKCKGNYPTISELDTLITPELEGDVFKCFFTLFAMTGFFCPSSHDAVCPDYLHIVRNVDEIDQFDFSSAIADKLIVSIEAFNSGNTCVLGGNLFSLMVIIISLCNLVFLSFVRVIIFLCCQFLVSFSFIRICSQLFCDLSIFYM